MKKLLAFILTAAAVLSLVQLEDTALAVSEKVLRLHVLAASDSEEDQAKKLMARDAVLEYLAPLLADCGTRQEALAELGCRLEDIASAAARASGQEAGVSIVREGFSAREYGGFGLPAGEYLSLKIELEGGAGRNWWCVVFPMLCSAAGDSGEDALALFEEDEARLISGSGRVIRFRLIEWMNYFAERLGV